MARAAAVCNAALLCVLALALAPLAAGERKVGRRGSQHGNFTLWFRRTLPKTETWTASPVADGSWKGLCRPDTRRAKWTKRLYGQYTWIYSLSEQGFRDQECKCCCASGFDSERIRKPGELYCVPLSQSKDFYTMWPGCYKTNGPFGPDKGQVKTHNMDKYWPRLDVDDPFFDPSDPGEDLMNAPAGILETVPESKHIKPPSSVMGWTKVTTGIYKKSAVPDYCTQMFQKEIGR
mmetsp:Transcript_19411/g.44159  ORF Transcript_19411/g.44159 Transcript_19411/m.44159 type:complete len:234 (-) Transcript_19411:65-766(-)